MMGKIRKGVYTVKIVVDVEGGVEVTTLLRLSERIRGKVREWMDGAETTAILIERKLNVS